MYSYYPNPADGELIISYDTGKKTKKDFEVKLLDSKGRVLSQGKNNSDDNKIHIDTRNIVEGTYFLHISEGKNLIKKQIIIKHD